MLRLNYGEYFLETQINPSGNLSICCGSRDGGGTIGAVGLIVMFTNPVMYKKIKTQKTSLSLYTERLVRDGLIPEGEIEDMKASFQAKLNNEFEAGKDYKPNKADWLDGKWSHLDGLP